MSYKLSAVKFVDVFELEVLAMLLSRLGLKPVLAASSP